MTSPITLKDNPDWHQAAQAMVDGCASLPSLEKRVQLLEKLCTDLGDNLYPAFLQILCLIAKNGDGEAHYLITDTLVHALTTGRLPSGKLSAWGTRSLSTTSAFGQNRSLGPIEYLCAWYSQPSGRSPLSANAFQQSMHHLLNLVSANEAAKQMYCTKLSADIQDPVGGTLSSQTRAAMEQLILRWQQGNTAQAIIDAYINALQGDRLDRLNNINSLFKR